MVLVSVVAIHHSAQNDCDSSDSRLCIRISSCLFFHIIPTARLVNRQSHFALTDNDE